MKERPGGVSGRFENLTAAAATPARHGKPTNLLYCDRQCARPRRIGLLWLSFCPAVTWPAGLTCPHSITPAKKAQARLLSKNTNSNPAPINGSNPSLLYPISFFFTSGERGLQWQPPSRIRSRLYVLCSFLIYWLVITHAVIVLEHVQIDRSIRQIRPGWLDFFCPASSATRHGRMAMAGTQCSAPVRRGHCTVYVK